MIFKAVNMCKITKGVKMDREQVQQWRSKHSPTLRVWEDEGEPLKVKLRKKEKAKLREVACEVEGKPRKGCILPQKGESLRGSTLPKSAW